MLTARPATTLDDLHQAQAIDTAAWVAGDPLAVGTPGALAWWHASSAPDGLDEHLRLWSEGDRVVAWTWHDGGEVEWGVWTGEPRRDRAVVAAVTAAIVAEAGDGTVAMWTAEDDGVVYGRRARRRFSEHYGELAAALCAATDPTAPGPGPTTPDPEPATPEADRFATALRGLAELARVEGLTADGDYRVTQAIPLATPTSTGDPA